MSDETKAPVRPPEHARGDAESTERVEPETTGNATDAAETVQPTGTLYGAELPVEIRYEGPEPELTVELDGTRHKLLNVARVQLTHDAGPHLPVLAFWTYPIGGQPVRVPAAELYDVTALRRTLTNALLRAATNRAYARRLALEAAALALELHAPELPKPGTLHAIVDTAVGKLAVEHDPLPTVRDSVTRACILGDDARRLADSVDTALHTRDVVPLLRDMAAAMDVLCDHLATVWTTPGAFTAVQPRNEPDAEQTGGAS